MKFFKILTLFCSIFCMPIQHQAFAGGSETGNGGGVWACLSGNDEAIEWVRLVDLYEASNEFHLNIPSLDKSLSFIDILDLKKARIANALPLLSKEISARLNQIISSLVFIDADLKIIEDSLYRIIPSKSSCPNGKIQYIQLANYTNYNKVLVQNSIWNHPLLSETDKSALILHEAIYLYCREKLGDTTSTRSRQIIGLIFSDIEEKKLGQKLKELFKIKDSISKPLTQQKYFKVGSVYMMKPIEFWKITCGFTEEFLVLDGNVNTGWKIQTGRINNKTAIGHQCSVSSTIININKKIGENSWSGESQLKINHSNNLNCSYPVTFQVTFNKKIDDNGNNFSWADVKINYPVILSNASSCFGDSRGDYFMNEEQFYL